MAYYSKNEIIEYVNENLENIESKNLKPLTPKAQTEKQLNDEEDIVGFFWIEIGNEEGQDEEDGEKIKFQGKSFFRVDADVYTDDRFALDLYEAMKGGVNVIDIIKRREQEKEVSKAGIVNIQELEQKVKNADKDGD